MRTVQLHFILIRPVTRIKGEWSSLIARTNKWEEFWNMHTEYGCSNNRKYNIIDSCYLKQTSTASGTYTMALCKKISALMTLCVANNLLIEEQIENTLSSSHILFHLLCVSHTCEVFKKGIISVFV